MLIVPQEIKDLLHQDHCQKNIRIHFPNGERSDICNNLIVKDSVSFTESICSQNTLKFGLCEASVFECETVGVGNIKDAKIRVYCEVYCDPSVSGAVFKTDLQAYVYPIPYGVFTVDSCQRQADMIHRRIVAYGGTASIRSNTCLFEKYYKLYYEAVLTEYTPNAFLFAIENSSDGVESSSVFDSETITPEEGFEAALYNYDFRNNWDPEFHWDYCTIYGSYKRWNYDGNTLPIADLQNLFMLNGKDLGILRSEEERLLAFLQTKTDTQLHFSWVFSDNLNHSSYGLHPTIQMYYAGYPYTTRWGIYKNYPDLRFPLLFYPYYNGKGLEICVLEKFILRCYKGSSHSGSTKYEWESAPLVQNVSLKKYSLKDTFSFLSSYTLAFPVEYVYETESSTFSAIRPIFGNLMDGSVYNAKNVLSPIIELMGRFGTVRRSGAFDIIDIKQQFGLRPDSDLYPGQNLYPQAVTGGSIVPNDYQSCWYDDEYTKPYGAIQCVFTDTDNNQIEYTMYLDGFDGESDPNSYQIYSLSDNSYISSGIWTQAQIEAYCNAIADAIEGVTYMPVDFVGRGLPYVEAGDTFEILTRSNDSITTIVLNKTTTGEQTLTDSYKSV